jgi:hypothetical protein
VLREENIFIQYKVYGPIYHKRIDRYMIHLVSSERRTSMTYARYLMCIKEGRWLNMDEHVDHINDDRLDDRIENLQILSQLENNRKSAKGRTMVELSCPRCNKIFTRERRQTHIVKGGNPSTCSRSCGSKPRS